MTTAPELENSLPFRENLIFKKDAYLPPNTSGCLGQGRWGHRKKMEYEGAQEKFWG